MLDTSSLTVPPASVGGGNTTEKLGKFDQNYTDFLKLLTTQLQNQDPSEPTDTNALTQQIATLSQVEQQLKTNDNLEKLISMYSATQYNSIVSYIGKQIEAQGDTAHLDVANTEFKYNLAQSAQNVTLTIKDADGTIVRTVSGASLSKSAGDNSYVWDGRNNQGQLMAPGSYTMSVVANGANNTSISATGSTAALKTNTPQYIYYMASDATKLTITIKDKSGAVVRTDTTSGTKVAGRNSYYWDGKDNNGNPMEPGDYKIEVAAKDAADKDISVKTFMIGIVTSVDSVGGVAYLSIGDLAIPLENVTSIRSAPQNS